MGKYDIGAEYIGESKLSIADLCEELMDEFEEKNPEKIAPGEETLRDKFKNHDKSGLIDKLDSCIGYNIEIFFKSNPYEKLSALKILKLLYYIEKDGDSKIRITDILAKPRLDNIPNRFSDKSVYASVFSHLFESIKKEVKDADAREVKIEKLNAYWEYITDKVVDYVITDRAFEEPQKSEEELARIGRFLTEKVLSKFKNAHLSVTSYREGAMETFYNILCCHRLLCNEVDRININYQICLSPPPSSEYIKLFRKYEGYTVSNQLAVYMEKALCSNEKVPEAELTLALISYGTIETEEIRHYKFALKYFHVISHWIEQHTDADFSNGIFLGVFVSIMQELISVKKTDERFLNDYYGNRYTQKPLLAAVKKPANADAVIIQAWVKKVQNRFAVNMGAYTLIEKKRLIENTIYEIKQELYKYQNIDDLEFANDVICHFVARSVMSRGLAMTIGNNFAENIAKQLRNTARKLTFIMWPEAVNVLDMFREFLVDNTDVADLVAADIARQINEFYQEESTVVGRGMRCDFETSYNSKQHRDFVLIFFVDRKIHQFEYLQFYEVISDRNAEKMEELGLSGFVKNE